MPSSLTLSVRAAAVALGVRSVVCLGLSVSLWPAHSAGGEAARESAPAPARQQQLIRLVRHDCGSCHGLTLAGGLGPALDRQALQTKVADFLRVVILDGRPGTAMPPWRGLLSDTDVRWIAERLIEGFPDAP